MENDSLVKLTKLNYATLYPSSFEKQKVILTINVFNEEIVAVLELNDKKRHCSISQCNNTIMELFKYQNKKRFRLTK